MTTQQQNERAARFCGIDNPPTREYAMCRVASSKVSSTGAIFTLRDGRHVLMPGGQYLPKPSGCDDWNDRYFFHVAEVLGDEIAAEVDAYRMPPPDFANDANAWPQIHAELERRGLLLHFCFRLCDVMDLDITSEAYKPVKATPRQRLAALMLVLEEVENVPDKA